MSSEDADKYISFKLLWTSKMFKVLCNLGPVILIVSESFLN